VDVVWFSADGASAAEDRIIEARLRYVVPGVPWSVTNQARMHVRNGDAPYRDTADGMRCWPETATAVAARWNGDVEILAPFGLDDLFALVLCPTPRFTGEKRPVFEARAVEKRWRQRWPLLRDADI
jgi:hypothetical protein